MYTNKRIVWFYRKNRLQDSHVSIENNSKAVLSKSYNKTKRFEKESFDSEFLNSSQSIKFGASGSKHSYEL